MFALTDIDSMPDEKIFWMIDMSYDLVLKGLKKKEREAVMSL